MRKSVLVISGSLRKNSNSQALAERFAAGAASAGHDVETISLAGKELGFCRGCLACQSMGRCVMRDDADAIEQRMCDADVLVFATPVYYYGMCGQLKTMLDRANPLYAKDYRFRSVYLLASAAEDDARAFQRTVSGIEGWVECFGRARYAGGVLAGGVTAAGDIEGHAELEAAYDLGAGV